MENSMMSEMSRVTVSEKGAASATIVRRIESLFLLLCIFLYCFVSSAQAVETGTGEILAMEAARLEEQGQYSQALEQYSKALPLLLEAQNDELAQVCSDSARKLMIIRDTYPYSLSELKELILQAYPEASEEQITLWTTEETLHKWTYDGETHYFSDTVANLKYRYLDLMFADEASQASYGSLLEDVLAIIAGQPDNSFTQYGHPAQYRGIHTISVPRGELPQTGTLRLWLPIPINTGAQTETVIESVTPEKWMKFPASIDRDIGLAYLEVPLEELEEDLLIQLAFVFTHYEQHYDVDPTAVGEYDRDSEVYRHYTGSYGNTEINDEIIDMANHIAGDESNPYLAARKIYDYIVENVTYCLMPHLLFHPRTEMAESSYVHRYQQGDCGAQSMYFTAMCRALGIPARTTGGWQLFSGEFSGHFWAEFYLPNYGWIPVDTSFGQLSYYPKEASAEDQKAFIDFCFASQDSMRCVVQKDTDIPLIPKAQGMVLLPLAIQMPAVEYSIPSGEMWEAPVLEHWTLSCEKIY
jgi:transglutaminase-like putative cysteine protease